MLYEEIDESISDTLEFDMFDITDEAIKKVKKPDKYDMKHKKTRNKNKVTKFNDSEE